ncbi:MAG: phosphoglucosamine mutase, partial [Acidimicrobiia bacterium]|nr:phosphoglucosamine mutase [Acidimicrobiia bacterium]
MSGADMSPFPSFGTDGVRGVAIVEVSPEYVMALGRAVARVLKPSRVVLGRDPRLSGPVLEAAFSAGVSAEGVRVEEFGVLPTPALAMIAAVENVPAVVITASHNTYTDNGVKVFAAGGRKLLDEQERAIESETLRILSEGTGPIRRDLEVGVVMRRSDGTSLYVDHLVDIFGEGSLAGLRIVVDTANGAMSKVAPLLLQRLGADVIVMNDAPDGT